MDSEVFELRTGTRLVSDVTEIIRRFCAPRGSGLCHVFVPHATAGLAIMELGSGSDTDLARWLQEAFPRDDRYSHSHGSRGHGADHLLPALIAPSLSVPVRDGEVLLGTWQSVVLVDPNPDNPQREVRVSFVEG
ncbi:MAG: secondary thiamine-phosphate synthase enzyme YjbQ [Acidimicrobiales bacterium]